jgi:uncharacterized protein
MRLKALWSDNSPYSKFLILVGVVLLSSGVFITLAFMLLKPLFGLDLAATPDALTHYSDPVVIKSLKFVQVVQSISFFIIPSLIFTYAITHSPLNYLKMNRPLSQRSVLLVILAMLVAVPLINWMAAVNKLMDLPDWLAGMEKWMKESELTAEKLTHSFLIMNGPADLFLTIFLMALLPAIGEEMLFRGVVQRLFADWTKSVHAGIVLSAILFSAIHMQFYGFLPRMVLGMYLGYLFAWSGSLWLPIIAHFVNNAAAVTFEYVNRNSSLKLNSDEIGARSSDLVILAACAVVFSAISYRIYGQNNGNKAEPGSLM